MPYKDKRQQLDYQKQWRLKNSNKIKKDISAYTTINKEKIKESRKKYYQRNKEKFKQQKKEYYNNNKENLKLKNRIYYQENKSIIKQKQAEHYKKNKYKRQEYLQKNREIITKKRKIYRENNKDRILNQQRKYKEIHKLEINKKYKDKYQTQRRTVIGYYSNNEFNCKCCNESEYKFLTIDHINNDGNIHRKEFKINSGNKLISWIIKNNFPDIFQILCFNCNLSKGLFGKCPHQI